MIGGSTSTKWFFVYLIPGQIGVRKCCILRRGETSRRMGENQQQAQPTYGVDVRIWTLLLLPTIIDVDLLCNIIDHFFQTLQSPVTPSIHRFKIIDEYTMQRAW